MMWSILIISWYVIAIPSSSFVTASSKFSAWNSDFPAEVQQRSFNSPNDLKTHLDTIGDYYAVVGRPRFGKREIKEDLMMLRNIRNKLPKALWNRILWALMRTSMMDKNSE